MLEEPLNEALEQEVEQTKKELEDLTKDIVDRRERMKQVLTEVVTSIVEDETKEALFEAERLDTPHTTTPTPIDRDAMKIIESDYDEAIGLLAHLDKCVPPNVSKFDSISRVFNSTK